MLVECSRVCEAEGVEPSGVAASEGTDGRRSV